VHRQAVPRVASYRVTNELPIILLWLFVLDLGVVFGAGLYEARISVPRWIGRSSATADVAWHPEEALRDDVGRRFWGLTTTLALTVLTLANLWAALRSSAQLRYWWLAAVLAALGDRALTFSYFIPRMLALLRSGDSTETRAKAIRWARFGYIRLALVLIAWLAAMRTFALLYQRGM
jgi:hypothetical protein